MSLTIQRGLQRGLIPSARRREAEDLQAMLDGRRASTPAATATLSPLVALTRGLPVSDIRPREQFRSDLRDRLLTEAEGRVPAPRELVPVLRERRSAAHRVRQAVAAVAVAAVVAGAGAAAASTRALPGDSLYGLKRQIENAQLALARGDLGRGRELLEQADARLGEAEALAAGEGSRSAATRLRVAGSLTDMDTAVAAATDDLTRAYRETGDAEPMQLLDRFLAGQRERLDDLLPLLGPALRAQVRALAQRLAAIEAEAGQAVGTAYGAGGPGGAGAVAGQAARRGTDGRRAATGAAGGLVGAVEQGVDGASRTVNGVPGTAGSAAGASGGPGSSRSSAPGSGGLPGTGGTVATTPLPTAGAPRATVSVPLPGTTLSVPPSSGNPVVTSPAATTTAAGPLPTVTGPTAVSACVPVPPLTTC